MEELKNKISDYIYNQLEDIYCYNCRYNYYNYMDIFCDECHRKNNNWCISKTKCDTLAEEIIKIIKTNG